jgi:hypothetical protein
MELHQISVFYDPAADRLKLLVRGREGEQIGGWLTRRLMMRLWPALQTLVAELAAAAALPSGSQPVPEARAMLSDIRRAQAVQQADFRTPMQTEGTRHPFGEEALLISEVNLGTAAAQRLRIEFKAADGRSFHLDLAQDMAQAWLHLTEKALSASEWELPRPEPAALAAPRVPQLLN